MSEKITILGAGAWGLGLAHTLMDNGHEVLLWTLDEDFVKEFNSTHKTSKYLKDYDISFNDKIKSTTNMDEAINFSKYVIITLPTQVIRSVLTKLNLKEPKIFINGAKGIEIATGMVISDIINDVIDPKYIAGNVTISGPSHAEEVVQRMITAVTISCKDVKLAEEVRRLFSTDYFKLYVSTAQKEIQLAAALKNVIAIASGIVSGMGYGDNTRAALVSRGLVEMVRFAKYEGGDGTALFGLAGLGDLVVTAYSNHSRNFTFGYYIGQGYNVEEATKKVGATIEGAQTLKVLVKLAREYNIDMPISFAINDVVYNNVSPKDAIKDLINRSNIFDNNY